MKKIRAIILLAFPFLCWGALTTYFLSQGNAWAATFASLPFIAFVLLVAFPRAGLGHFAFTHEIGPVEEVEETQRQYHLKMAKWWFAGSLLFPVCIALAFLFSKFEGFALVTMFVGIILGIPCFLKCLGSLYQAIRARS
ncbi:hypothetical protein FKG94_16640 [Exilibacterium tricleocarpae]|uniref:Uncharacterized protein n=1 Tax=Exilibacterium tricleocarpae TaxID=2591008 RepID=A0A545TAI4_9GAMM|nr:hypothetical protein [Exilibacterium tricleocarpae]TQV74233.1 hypothetical protein FKG94_16640 [Exilibacterium tricleocarpae]